MDKKYRELETDLLACKNSEAIVIVDSTTEAPEIDQQSTPENGIKIMIEMDKSGNYTI